jgi:uncharacterized protein YutE (UPF0331/DUF86 family)
MLERLIQLEDNIMSLERLRQDNSAADVSASRELQWAVRYGLIETIQIVIDTACGVCNKNNLGSPRNYGDCLRLLKESGYIPAGLSATLIRIVGLRNLLIHEYTMVDDTRLYEFLGELEVFRDYAVAIREHL